MLLPGRTKSEGTVRYPGIEVDGALEMVERTEVQYPNKKSRLSKDGRAAAISSHQVSRSRLHF
jgi:hypothetical protein